MEHSQYEATTEITIPELEKYAELEGSEIGEASLLLCRLWRYRDCLSDVFMAALCNEITEHLQIFKASSQIVTKTREETITWDEIEWL